MNGGYEMHDIPITFNGRPRRYIWEYRGSENEILGYVARFDADGKKDVVPYFQRVNGHGWNSGSPAKPRPLFGLQILARAEPDEPIYVVEGEKAAAALQSLGLIAVTSQGGSQASSKSDWKSLAGQKHIYILPDNDEAGEAYARETVAILAGLENPPVISIVRLPNLSHGGDIVDWIAAYVEDALLEWDGFKPVPESGIDIQALLREFKKEIDAHAVPAPAEWESTSQANADWDTPISLESAPLPAWPNDVFPSKIQDFVTALSASTETPPELAALLVLAAISSAAQGKYKVQVKTDYSEPVNIWVCVALPPGSRKTAVQQAATAPLTAWERRQQEDLGPKMKQAASEYESLAARIKQLRKDAGQASDSEFKELKEKIAEAEAELPEIPTAPQVWAQDVTPENLGSLMATNDERMAILSDESGIFDILAGRYSNGIPNLDLFLQGHAGSPVKVNRSSRPAIVMYSPALTLGLSPQPEVLRGLIDTPSFRGRGLLGRFLYALPYSNLGYRTLDRSPMHPNYRAGYEATLTHILDHELPDSDDDASPPYMLKLTIEAAKKWQSFALSVEAGMREGGMYDHLTDWAGKFPGAVIRVAALLHIARYADTGPWKKDIGAEDMEAALRMAEVLSVHALAVFDLMGADPALDGARLVLRWIKREGKSEFTFRDCHQAHKSRYKRAKELDPIIDVLIERHFIRQRVEKVAHRPSRVFEVNPAVLSNS
ncbi:Protein of unknown function [Nitrosospira multiformis]|uniref:Toprim domain-containing protein n=2 Tax=Nitrosospira multiformis TaxID=1231 RepID=A0A1I7H8Y6_9PROT|nr:Protein of unknown function [Nitrosospira multiformis]